MHDDLEIMCYEHSVKLLDGDKVVGTWDPLNGLTTFEGQTAHRHGAAMACAGVWGHTWLNGELSDGTEN